MANNALIDVAGVEESSFVRLYVYSFSIPLRFALVLVLDRRSSASHFLFCPVVVDSGVVLLVEQQRYTATNPRNGKEDIQKYSRIDLGDSDGVVPLDGAVEASWRPTAAVVRVVG